jgi:phage shock protein PspC (stress-responsive transcriptional regulator)
MAADPLPAARNKECDMPRPQPSVIARDHTILGVCEALGEDFGFNPFWLRLAFALPLMVFPVAVFTVYLGVGAIVLVSRLLAPAPRRTASQADAEPAPAPMDSEQMPLPLAA